MTAQTDVIDWQEAMQQCGDDEEFLREVLADLRTEVEAQLSIIAEIINVSILPLVSPFTNFVSSKLPLDFVSHVVLLQNPQGTPYHQIMRSAHLLKGAAANLMCGPLRTASMQLEESARAAHEQGEASSPPDVQAAVQTAHRNLQQAAQNFVAFLFSIGL